MENTHDIHVESINTSLIRRDGSSTQLSEQDAVCHSLMKTERQLSETLKQVTILASLLQSIIENTVSSDVLELAVHSSKEACKVRGIDEATYKSVVSKVFEVTEKRRRRNPFAY
jgi:hypothetical protein